MNKSIDDATPAEWNALRKPPAHYTQGNIEVIEVIRDTLDSEQFKAYCQGNVLKYVMRANHHQQPTVEHLRKARDYLNWWIDEEVQP